MGEVIAENGVQRLHRKRLENLLQNAKKLVRIASAYVTDTKLFLGVNNPKIQLLVSISSMDIVSGATSLYALKASAYQTLVSVRTSVRKSVL